LAKALTFLFRDSTGELAALPPGESEVFCFLAGGVEIAGDEPKSDDVGLFGVEGCEGAFGGRALPIKLLARVEEKSWRITYKYYKTILLTVFYHCATFSSKNKNSRRGNASNFDQFLKCVEVAHLAGSPKAWWHIAYRFL
jgi:hypothetical protein